MAATVLYRMAGSPKETGACFADVSETAWYHDAAVWVYANGLTQDFADVMLEPNQNITRMELASMLYRWFNCENMVDYGVLDGFTDGAQIPDAYRGAMAWAVSEGIFQGNGGQLAGASELTRCQFAAIAGRITALVEKQ